MLKQVSLMIKTMSLIVQACHRCLRTENRSCNGKQCHLFKVVNYLSTTFSSKAVLEQLVSFFFSAEFPKLCLIDTLVSNQKIRIPAMFLTGQQYPPLAASHWLRLGLPLSFIVLLLQVEGCIFICWSWGSRCRCGGK